MALIRGVALAVSLAGAPHKCSLGRGSEGRRLTWELIPRSTRRGKGVTWGRRPQRARPGAEDRCGPRVPERQGTWGVYPSTPQSHWRRTALKLSPVSPVCHSGEPPVLTWPLATLRRRVTGAGTSAAAAGRSPAPRRSGQGARGTCCTWDPSSERELGPSFPVQQRNVCCLVDLAVWTREMLPRVRVKRTVACEGVVCSPVRECPLFRPPWPPASLWPAP